MIFSYSLESELDEYRKKLVPYLHLSLFWFIFFFNFFDFEQTYDISFSVVKHTFYFQIIHFYINMYIPILQLYALMWISFSINSNQPSKILVVQQLFESKKQIQYNLLT